MVNLRENARLRVAPDATRPRPALRIGAYPPVWAPNRQPPVSVYLGSRAGANEVLISGPGVKHVQCVFWLRPDNGAVMFAGLSQGETSQVLGGGANSTPFGSSSSSSAQGPRHRTAALAPGLNTGISLGIPGGDEMLRFSIVWPDGPYPRTWDDDDVRPPGPPLPRPMSWNPRRSPRRTCEAGASRFATGKFASWAAERSGS